MSKEVYGHDEILKRLSNERPHRALFVGPYSVGKRTTFEWYVDNQSLQNVQRVYDLDTSIKYIQDQARFKDQTFFITLNKAKKSSIEALLKVLEDSDSSNVFVISSTYYPNFALGSRLSEYKFTYLDHKSLEKIFKKLGYDPDTLPPYSLGSVASSVELRTNDAARVNLVISYINNHDPLKVDAMYYKWTDQDTKKIITLATEVITGINRMFSKSETEVVSKKLAMKILQKVNVFDRPRYVVRSSLVGIAEEMSK